MKKMKRYLVSLVMALVLAITPATVVLGATTADVTVTATPSFISISNNQTSFDFGTVSTSTNYTTSANWSHITNNSTAPTDIEISVTTSNWTGGDEWYHSDAGYAGNLTAALKAGNLGTNNVVVKYATPNDLVSGLPAGQDWEWNLEFDAPTSFSDSDEKSIVVRLTAVQAS